jgi:hypothetical protein
MNLKSERNWAIKTIKELQHEPIAFELDPAGGHIREWWRSKIAESDVFILLINSEISWPVFDEVETARRHRKRIFVFAKNKEYILRQENKSLHNLNFSEGALGRFYDFILSIKFKEFKGRNDLRKEIIGAIASISPKLTSVPDFLIVPDSELQRIRALYVPPTKKFEKALSIIESRRFLIITGPPHVGKTAMAYYLLSLAKERYNLDAIVRCTEYRDINLLFNQQNIGILIDDPFGKVRFESTGMGQYIDEVYKKFAIYSKEDKEKKNFVVVTSREEVFGEALLSTKVSEVPQDTLVTIIQEGDYSTNDLIKILHNHLSYYADKNSIGREQSALVKKYAHKIVKALRFPHNIGFFVENFAKDLTPENIDTAIENAGKIKEEVEKWYSRLDEKKDTEVKYFIFITALLPDSDPLKLERFYKGFIDRVNKQYNMNLSKPPLNHMRNKCSVYITENGLVNFKHPSYLEGVINKIRKQQIDDLTLFLAYIQPIIVQPVSPFMPLASQRQSGDVWDVIHVLRVSAGVVPDHSLNLIENLMKSAKERGILPDVFGVIERIGEVNPESVLPLLEELAKLDQDDLRYYTMRVLDKLSRIEPKKTFVCLKELAKSKAWWLRPYIANMLAKIGIDDPEMVLPVLKELLIDGTHYGKSSCVEALITLGHKWPSKVIPVMEQLSCARGNRLKYASEWVAAEVRKKTV